MHYAAVLLLFGGLAAAVPVANPAADPVANLDVSCRTRITCLDAVSPCGVKYGGCYDDCDPAARPVPPPCPPTRPPVTRTVIVTSVVTVRPPATTVTKQPAPTTTTTRRLTSPSTLRTIPIITRVPLPTTTRCNSSVTVCWDGVNECGMMYGGCFADCKPWPTFQPPPCPTRATLGTVIVTRVTTRITSVPTMTLRPV